MKSLIGGTPGFFHPTTQPPLLVKTWHERFGSEEVNQVRIFINSHGARVRQGGGKPLGHPGSGKARIVSRDILLDGLNKAFCVNRA